MGHTRPKLKPTSLLGQPATEFQLSLIPVALRRPRGGNATCLRVAVYFAALEPLVLEFEHVQISNRSHAYAEKLYHVTIFFRELPSRAPRGPEAARRRPGCVLPKQRKMAARAAPSGRCNHAISLYFIYAQSTLPSNLLLHSSVMLATKLASWYAAYTIHLRSCEFSMLKLYLYYLCSGK